MQRPPDPCPRVSGANERVGLLAVVGPLDLEVESRVPWQHEIGERQQEIASERVDVLVGELGKKGTIGIESPRVVHQVSGQELGWCPQNEEHDQPRAHGSWGCREGSAIPDRPGMSRWDVKVVCSHAVR
jgi:hypothetical protein